MKLTKFATALLIAGMGVSFAASAKVTVFAAASMTDALQQIADQYQTEKPNNTVVFSFRPCIILSTNALRTFAAPNDSTRKARAAIVSRL